MPLTPHVTAPSKPGAGQDGSRSNTKEIRELSNAADPLRPLAPCATITPVGRTSQDQHEGDKEGMRESCCAVVREGRAAGQGAGFWIWVWIQQQ